VERGVVGVGEGVYLGMRMRRPRIRRSHERFLEEFAREYRGYVGKAVDYV
jgi:hypothetical protein